MSSSTSFANGGFGSFFQSSFTCEASRPWNSEQYRQTGRSEQIYGPPASCSTYMKRKAHEAVDSLLTSITQISVFIRRNLTQ